MRTLIAARAAELGGKVVVPPFDAPWVRTTVLADPQGATFVASKFSPENRDVPEPQSCRRRRPECRADASSVGLGTRRGHRLITRGLFRGRPGPGPRVRGRVQRKAGLTWLALALLTVGSVGDLGSAPASAVFGLPSVVLYVVPAVVFLVPAALVSAELASGWRGGVYNWVRLLHLRRGRGQRRARR